MSAIERLAKTHILDVGGGATYEVNSVVSLPVSTFNTIVLAINSTSSGYFSRAAVNAASASGKRPKCNSAMA
jgi:hypothetical protein